MRVRLQLMVIDDYGDELVRVSSSTTVGGCEPLLVTGIFSHLWKDALSLLIGMGLYEEPDKT